jgi:hypothetical protein
VVLDGINGKLDKINGRLDVICDILLMTEQEKQNLRDKRGAQQRLGAAKQMVAAAKRGEQVVEPVSYRKTIIV